MLVISLYSRLCYFYTLFQRHRSKAHIHTHTHTRTDRKPKLLPTLTCMYTHRQPVSYVCVYVCMYVYFIIAKSAKWHKHTVKQKIQHKKVMQKYRV